MSEGGFPEPVTVAFEVPFVAGQSRPRLTSRPFPHAVKPARDSERERAVADAFDEALAALGGTPPLAPKGVAVTVSVLCERPLPDEPLVTMADADGGYGPCEDFDPRGTDAAR